MISHNRKTGRLGFDILIDTGKVDLIYISIVFNRFSIKPNHPCNQNFSNTNDPYNLKNVSEKYMVCLLPPPPPLPRYFFLDSP